MGSRATELGSPPEADSTPEDVAALYSWANMQGAKYRDYSASRREYRAQVRYRAAKALLERELTAQEEAEASAAEAERIALEVARSQNDQNPAARVHSVRRAEAATRKAAADRVEAARRAEAAAHAAVLALREEREISDAHSSAQRKAQVYQESEQRRRRLAGPQPRMGRGNPPAPPAESQDAGHEPQALASAPTPENDAPSANNLSGLLADWIDPLKLHHISAETPVSETDLNSTVPAWLHNPQTPPTESQPSVVTAAISGAPAAEVAARWPVLNEAFANPSAQLPLLPQLSPAPAHTQILAIFSLAGGVGKTSLAAALSRALSSHGEKVIVTDATSHGLLPIYFGARELRPGEVTTVPARPGTQPLSLATYNLAAGPDEATADAILRNAQGHHRLVLDLPSGSDALLRRIADLKPIVLVPLAPDINSVVTLIAMERLFRSITDAAGRAVLPIYVLNQFDATQPLHLDVREALTRQLADRLLPTVIRRSPAVSEALAHGTTVLDYAPDAPVSHDYLDLASWLTSVSPPIRAETRSGLRGVQ